MRLDLVSSGSAFEQPCAALADVDAGDDRDGGAARTCAIYDDRPRACRAFGCRLFDRHRWEGGPLEPRLAAVRRVRELVAELHARGLTAADFAGEGAGRSDHRAAALFDELTERLERDFARADPASATER